LIDLRSGLIPRMGIAFPLLPEPIGELKIYGPVLIDGDASTTDPFPGRLAAYTLPPTPRRYAT